MSQVLRSAPDCEACRYFNDRDAFVKSLAERERRVAERVREETLRVAFFRLKSTLGVGQAQVTLGRIIDELRVTPLDALLKEEA